MTGLSGLSVEKLADGICLQGRHLNADQAHPPPAAAGGQPQRVPAGTPPGTDAPGRAADGEALLALAQEALAAEQRAHPDIARRSRPQLTPQIDPLFGLRPPATGSYCHLAPCAGCCRG